MMGGWSAFQFAERRMPPWTKSILRPGNGRRTAGRGPAAGGVIWRFLLLTYVSTSLLSMPVSSLCLANGHGPLGRLPVGFRAKSAIFLARAEKSCFSRCDAGALAVGELVSRTDKDSTASYG